MVASHHGKEGFEGFAALLNHLTNNEERRHKGNKRMPRAQLCLPEAEDLS